MDRGVFIIGTFRLKIYYVFSGRNYQIKKPLNDCLVVFSGQPGARTLDPRIKSPLLYQLS